MQADQANPRPQTLDPVLIKMDWIQLNKAINRIAAVRANTLHFPIHWMMKGKGKVTNSLTLPLGLVEKLALLEPLTL